MKISVVSTLYKSLPFLEDFIKLTLQSLKEINCTDYEIIFVNDGSPDNSLEFLLEQKQNLPQIKIVDLSRNFGHHYAMQAGLKYSKGEYVFLIDNDLETSPLILNDFYNEVSKDSSLDVVYGYQEERKGNWLEKYTGRVFWYLINKISDVRIPYNILTERLMTRKYVDALLSLKDANLFMGGLFHWVGFKQKGIAVTKGIRKGKSTYSVNKRIELMFQAITSFSGKPLVWLFYFGILLSLLSILFIISLIIRKFIYGDIVQLGWTSIIALNLLILGIISTFIGIIGFYLFKIFKQVQGRPNSIIKNIYE